MQNKIFLALIMTALVAGSAFTDLVTGTAPIISGGNQTALENAFQSALDEINDNLPSIGPKPELLIKAFGDSGLYSSHGATQRAFGGYKSFAVTFGGMVGLALPDSPLNIIGNPSGFLDSLTDRLEAGDMRLGVLPQGVNANISINTSKFLIKDLYLGVHLGYMKLDNVVPGLTYDYLSLGATLNYQLIKPVGSGLFSWRGVNIGSGFIYQGTKLGYALNAADLIDPISQGFGSGGTSGTLTITPKSLNLNVDVSTYVVPVEVTTAIRLLWFLNIPIGVGADIGFGKSELTMGMDASMDVQGAGITTTTPGSLAVNVGGNMAPSLMNLKVMSGLGLKLGPVVIDIPITWYFQDDGLSVGLTVGFIW